MKKRLIAIMMVVVMMLSSIPAVFAENDKNVSKVTFKNMSTSKFFVGLGGIRLYNNNVLLDSGARLSASGTTGELEHLSVVATSSYYENLEYQAPNAIDHARPQVGTSDDQCYWISANYETSNQEYAITLKTPQPLDKIEFVTSFDNPDVIIDNPFIVEITYDDGTTKAYDVTPSLVNAEVQTLELVDDRLSIDITSDSYDVSAGSTFTLDIALSNATEIYAEDFVLKYDANYFELLSEELIDSASSILQYQSKTEGEARYIVSANGTGNGITGNAPILRVTMKAKTVIGSSEITFKNALVATADGVELVPVITPKTFNVIEKQGDVNGDDVITLADLAIASKLLNTTSTAWGSFTPDIDGNGTVELADLTIITTNIAK